MADRKDDEEIDDTHQALKNIYSEIENADKKYRELIKKRDR